MSEALVAARWLVEGQVQGVGFRWSTLRYASRIGVGGWVRNLPDGRVEVVAKGTPNQLAELERFVRDGPGPAYVENVEKTSIPHEDVTDKTFVIK